MEKLLPAVLIGLAVMGYVFIKQNVNSFQALTASIQKTAPATLTPTPTVTPTPSPKPTHVPTTPTVIPTKTPPPVNNAPPTSGYRRQSVQTPSGTFSVDIISADLNSTRVLIDTASDSDCSNDCPVLPLGTYASRSGAFAAINGSFFCPASYPQCAGKTNSFDTLLMNKNKTYFNSANNVYSVVPAVIFSGNSARFVSQSLQWGRDTAVDAVLSNHPLLVFNGASAFGGNSDPKLESRGARTFVGSSGNTVYIGIVHNTSSTQAAQVLQTLGMQNALGLDQGGSTALWHNGRYLAGPGRNIPNAIVLTRK